MIPRLLNVFICSLRAPLLKNASLLCQGWGGKTCLIFLHVASQLSGHYLFCVDLAELSSLSQCALLASFAQKGSLLLDLRKQGHWEWAHCVCQHGAVHTCALCAYPLPPALGFPKGTWLYCVCVCVGGGKLVNRPTGVSIEHRGLYQPLSGVQVGLPCLSGMSIKRVSA